MLAGIIVVALSLRMAVTSVPPLISAIGRDVPLSPAAVGVLGMLPPVAFAFFGYFTPLLLRRYSLEVLTVAAMACAVLGQVGRVFTDNTVVFLLLSLTAFAGLGAGNVLMPPLVRAYFPERIGLMTALYVTAVALGTAIPPFFSVPLSDGINWQFSTAIWALLSMVAVIPWFTTLDGSKASVQRDRMHAAAGPHRTRIKVWKSPTALGLTLMMGCTSLNTYAAFAWLPALLTEAGLGRAQAGSLLGLYALVGVPLSLAVPVLAAKMRNPFPAVVVFLACYVVGYVGLAAIPGTLSWMWVVLIGLGPGTFPLSLVLINLRTRTQEGTAALSGFTQGIGYALACIGPLAFGMLREVTGGWTIPIAFLGLTLAALVTGARYACRPRMVEDSPGVLP